MKGTIAKAIAVILFSVALLTAVSIAAASAASHNQPAPKHAQVAKRVHRYGPYWVPAPPAHANHSLPFRLDLTSLGAVGGCLLVLASWGVWQTRRRCTTCGYCPAFCGCDELAQH
jgi:hypothetical protein